MTEKYTASPEMQKFFTNLLEYKQLILKIAKDHPNDPLWTKMYEKLDAIIKSTEEKK